MIRKETRIINGREAHLYYDEERQAYLVASDLMEVFLGLYENADGLVKELAEESKDDMVNKLAMMYAVNFAKFGIDVTTKLETATRNAMVVEQAYLRGRQDERDNFARWQEESNNGWIPFKQREMTEEEKEFYGEDLEYMLDCKLPDDDEEILVCYKSGYVGTATFIRDSDGCYLDSGSDFIDDAIAWQPLPPRYEPKEVRE